MLLKLMAHGFEWNQLQIHYLPVIRIAACKAPPVPSRKIRRNQSISCGVFFMTYLTLNDASEVYGCPHAETLITVSSIVGIALVHCIEIPLSQYFQRISRTYG